MKIQSLLTIAATSALIVSASASITMDWVTVGNPGNAAQSASNRSHNFAAGDGYGAVGYSYQIGKYEVTNAQYAVFLNAKAKSDPYGLYNTEMANYGIVRNGSSGDFFYITGPGLGNRPVVFVSWFDAARMANWMVNGQGGGSTETGAYTMGEYHPIGDEGETSGNFQANAGAQVYIPTENEWYKAAYYNGNTLTYSLYPTGQNTISRIDANFFYDPASTTDVGSYVGNSSMYGTFDQGGNVWEWHAAEISGSSRGLRGGSWISLEDDLRSSSRIGGGGPSLENYDIGFRLASVPEPSSLVLSVLASGVVLLRRKR